MNYSLEKKTKLDAYFKDGSLTSVIPTIEKGGVVWLEN